jgi:streptomycin 6-kinase
MVIKQPSFSSWIIARFAEEGCKWLSELPHLIQNLQEQWELSEIEPLNNSTYNFTAYCRYKNSQPAFLKIGFPGSGIQRESATLSAFAGVMIDIIACHAQADAMLLPRLNPAKPLHWLKKEAKQNQIAADLIKKLKPQNQDDFPFPALTEWFGILERFHKDHDSPIPVKYLENGRQIFAELEKDKTTDQLMHGDLHHHNILSDGDEWRIIDPKGVIGNPLFETACYMYNPSPELLKCPDLIRIIETRIAVFSEILKYHPQQIAMMAYCQSVLSACWCLEDKQDCWQNALAWAEVFYYFLGN